MPRIFTMGNVCPTVKPGTTKMSVPRSLAELLEDLTNIDPDDFDKSIEAHPVTKAFRDFLRDRNLEDDETALRFLVLTQALIVCDRKLKQPRLSESNKTSLRQQQEQIFRKAVSEFFAEESDHQLSLSNQDLFGKLASVAESNPVTANHLQYLRDARGDSSVWSELLEPTYLDFLAKYKPSVNIAACLLSIL